MRASCNPIDLPAAACGMLYDIHAKGASLSSRADTPAPSFLWTPLPHWPGRCSVTLKSGCAPGRKGRRSRSAFECMDPSLSRKSIRPFPKQRMFALSHSFWYTPTFSSSNLSLHSQRRALRGRTIDQATS
eukprot:56080-Eustigmatos_ZCMA.PRE.1